MGILFKFVKESKFGMLASWIALICAILVLTQQILIEERLTILQILFIIIICTIVYFAIIYTYIYVQSNKKLKWVNYVYADFAHMQIFLENHNIIIEVLSAEADKFMQLAELRNFKVERILEHNGIVRMIIK